MDEKLIEKYIFVFKELATGIRMFQQQNVFCEGLTVNQFHILDLIKKSNCCMEIKDLHQALQVKKSTTTRLLKPLIERKLIKKVRSKEDNRASKIILTESGFQNHADFRECLVKFIRQVYRQIPIDDHKTLIDYLMKFISIMKGCCSTNM